MKRVLFSLVAMLLLSVSGIAQTTFTKITSASGLEAGANYLIVAHHDDFGTLAMGYQKSNNRNAVVVSESGDAITVTLGTDPTNTTDVFQFTLGGNAGAWTLYDEVKGGYLYAASSTGNQLKTQTTLDANGQWSITFNNDGTAEVVAQGENTRNNMRFNPNTSNGDPLFSCYSETSNIDTRVSFYKAGGAPVPPPQPPTNYPTNFVVSEVNCANVTLTWNASAGEVPADAYLVVACPGNNTFVPQNDVYYDGVLSDGTVANNTEELTITFIGLEGNTNYHFAIFPYTHSGSYYRYKTDGNCPMVNVSIGEVSYLLNEDFEGGDLGDFFSYDMYGDQSWHVASYGGNSYAYMNGYASGAHANDDWLISNVLSGEYQYITLQFRSAMNYTGENLDLRISTDYDGVSEPTDFTWTSIRGLFNWSTGNYEWVDSGVVDITDYTGEHFCIAFVHKSTDDAAAAWEVDDVKVTACESLSVTEKPNAQLVVSPNPARDQVTFTLESDAQVCVFDMMGRKLSEMNAAAGEAQLSVSHLENGVYFVNIRYANGNTAVSKFVKF